MSTLPVSPKEVGSIVREKSELYQPHGARIPGDPASENLPTNATPENMRTLLDQLDVYTKAVQEAADEEGLTTDANVQQWSADMSNWQYRLGHYYEVLRTVPSSEAGTTKAADLIYFEVTAPLLDGVYYEVLPGIVLNEEEKQRISEGGGSNWKPPGVYTPFSLGNQVVEYRNHQRERWDKLWGDLKASLKKVALTGAQAIWQVVKAAAVAGVGGLVGGLVTYAAIRRRTKRTPPTGLYPPYQP